MGGSCGKSTLAHSAKTHSADEIEIGKIGKEIANCLRSAPHLLLRVQEEPLLRVPAEPLFRGSRRTIS